MPSAGNALRFAIGFCAWFLGAFMGFNLLRLGWTLDENGLSVMTGRLPYWDFTNLWGGGRMALQGHVDYLFDVELYRPALRTLLSPLMLDQEWSYPPSMLLLGAPLAMLPIPRLISPGRSQPLPACSSPRGISDFHCPPVFCS